MLRKDIDNLENGTQELTETNKAIKVGRKKKAMIAKKRIDTKRQLKESSMKMKKLSRARDSTKKMLEEKEEELALLLQGQHQSSIQSIIEDREAEIQELEHEVSRMEQKLSLARDAQVTTMTKHVEELSEKRDLIKKDLEKKEKELDLFRSQAQSQKNNAKWRQIIERKEAEVSQQRNHMTEVERELTNAKEEHKKLCDLLHETTVVLSEQCEQVRGLERSRAALERQWSRVDTKLKMEIAESKVCCGRKDIVLIL